MTHNLRFEDDVKFEKDVENTLYGYGLRLQGIYKNEELYGV